MSRVREAPPPPRGDALALLAAARGEEVKVETEESGPPVGRSDRPPSCGEGE